jgi:hypothetical protein
MKQAGNLSLKQLVLRVYFGALVGASYFLLLCVLHGPVRSNRLVVLAVDFVGLFALLLLGYAIVHQAIYRIDQGLDCEDWSPNELDPLRRIVRILTFAISAVYLAGVTIWTIQGLTSARLQLWNWAWFVLAMGSIQLHNVLKPKPKSSNTPIWDDLKPIYSDHWGEMNYPAR